MTRPVDHGSLAMTIKRASNNRVEDLLPAW